MIKTHRNDHPASMDIYLNKDSYNRFLPAFGSDYDNASKISVGETVKASITKPRNVQFHKKYFAMIERIHHCMDEGMEKVYPQPENVRYVIMILIGEFEIIILPDGTQNKKPKSISFASMDDLKFEEIYSKSLDAGLKYFLKDMDEKEFEREILGFL